LRLDQDTPWTHPNQESTVTQQAKATMAKTKQIFPNMSKTPQESGSSFLPILSVSAEFFQVFTRSLKKPYSNFKEDNSKNFTKQRIGHSTPKFSSICHPKQRIPGKSKGNRAQLIGARTPIQTGSHQGLTSDS